MDHFKLEQLLKGIKDRDNKVLSHIYREYYPLVQSYIQNNSGNNDDAKDVFQEALIVIYKSLQDNKLQIKDSFKAFLLGTSKLLWLKILRNRDIHERNIQLIEKPEHDTILDPDLLDEELETRLFRKHFEELADDCKKVLKMSLQGTLNDEIAKNMGYKSEKIVRNKKSKCKEYLAKKIKKDPEFKKR